MTERLLSVRDFANVIGSTISTVKRWTLSGMPCERTSVGVRIPLMAASDWTTEHANHKALRKRAYVYFATRPVDGAIKIGFTSDVQQRMSELGAELVVSIKGDSTLEAALHELFAGSRIEGEYFSATPELLDLIESLKGAA